MRLGRALRGVGPRRKVDRVATRSRSLALYRGTSEMVSRRVGDRAGGRRLSTSPAIIETRDRPSRTARRRPGAHHTELDALHRARPRGIGVEHRLPGVVVGYQMFDSEARWSCCSSLGATAVPVNILQWHCSEYIATVPQWSTLRPSDAHTDFASSARTGSHDPRRDPRRCARPPLALRGSRGVTSRPPSRAVAGMRRVSPETVYAIFRRSAQGCCRHRWGTRARR